MLEDNFDNHSVLIDKYCLNHDIDNYDLYAEIMDDDDNEQFETDIKFE